MGKKGYENGLGAMSAKERMAAYENGLGAMLAMSDEARTAASEKGYENGIGTMSAKERMAVNEKGYKNGIGTMSAEERMAASAKGYENGIGTMSASAAAKAAKRDAKWTAEIDASIENMIKNGVSFTKIAWKLGNGLSTSNIAQRWYRYLMKSSNITKPPVQPGFPSRITWSEDVDASIVRMRADGISFAKIASELGNGLSRNDIMNRWYSHLKDKLQ
jgi:hypothetical protein